MTFELIERRDTYNRRGDVIRTERRTVATFDDAVAMLAESYRRDPRCGFLISLTDRHCVSLQREHNAAPIDFAEIFRIVEGDEAYLAVIEGRAPGQVESEWIAAKLAR
jgi:hypothetical protein